MTLQLSIERVIAAPAAMLFEAWTTPALLKKWWGPANVTCDEAEVDLRVGGAYRLSNRSPEGHVVWISGTFEEIDPPHRLVYSWLIGDGPAERVTVTFHADGEGTRVCVHHEGIQTEAAKKMHAEGWHGCLDGLDGLTSA